MERCILHDKFALGTLPSYYGKFLLKFVVSRVVQIVQRSRIQTRQPNIFRIFLFRTYHKLYFALTMVVAPSKFLLFIVYINKCFDLICIWISLQIFNFFY